MNNIVPIKFTATQTAPAARVQNFDELPQAVRDLGLSSPRPVIVLVGGAGRMTKADLARLRLLFNEALAPIAEELGAVIVDGGTDAGVMRLMGQARASRNFPLVGVVVEQLAAMPSHHVEKNQWTLEAHHTHFVLTPGLKWGDEAIWISRLATVLADTQPSVTVLINGGDIAYHDAAYSVEQHRPVLIVEGSGGTADVLAKALRGSANNQRARQLAASGLLSSVQLKHGPAALSAAIRNLLHKE